MEEESKRAENNNKYITIEEYEEERKRQIVKNAAIENLPEEAPGAAEQLKQFYNSEQWKETIEGFNRAWKVIKEEMTPAFKAVAEVTQKLYDTIIKAYTVDPEIKKCYGIYKRTKKRKDQKKANDQDKKNNREEIY